MKRCTTLFAPLAVLLVLFLALPAYSQDEQQQDDSEDQIDGFTQCKKEGVNSGLSGKGLRAHIQKCRDQFPMASIFIMCKKNAFKKAKNDKKLLNNLVKECKKSAMQDFVEGKFKILPLKMLQNKLYFADLGFNSTINRNEFASENFDCSHLDGALRSPEMADYLLFGNAPNLFSAVVDMGIGSFNRKVAEFGRKNKPEDYVDIPGFFRIYGKNMRRRLFFPTGSCRYKGIFSKQVKTMTANYLIDYQTGDISPYFVTIFYNDNAKFKPSLIIKRIKGTLGKKYNSFKNDKSVHFLSTSEITQFDKEGDPENVCHRSSKHKYIGIIKQDGNKYANYVLIANIKNLCQYANKIIRRFKNANG